MLVRVFVCLCKCLCVRVNVSVCVCVCVCTFTYAFMYVYMYMCAFACVYWVPLYFSLDQTSLSLSVLWSSVLCKLYFKPISVSKTVFALSTVEPLACDRQECLGKVVVCRRWHLPELKPCTHDQVFLVNFSLTRSLAEKLVMPAFEKGDLSRKTCQFVSRTHEQTNLSRKTWSCVRGFTPV